MKYYVVDCMTGVKTEDCCFDTLEEAKETSEKWSAEESERGHQGNYWSVIDENGNKY